MANLLKLSETTHFSSSIANHVVLIMLQTRHDSSQTLGNIQHETRKVLLLKLLQDSSVLLKPVLSLRKGLEVDLFSISMTLFLNGFKLHSL
jgi:hypothetical protein